jgi:uncharacterized protein
MRVQTFTDPGLFLDLAGPWLHDRMAENSLMLGIATRAAAVPGLYSDERWFALVLDGDRPLLAALRTPPRPAVLSCGELAAAPALAEAIRRDQPDNPGVIGPREEATAVSLAWGGHDRVERMAMRGYELLEVRSDPRRPTGVLRAPRSEEHALLERWIAGFRRDAQLTDPEPVAEVADRMMTSGRAFIFAVHDRPVSLVAGAVDLPGAARIGLVYTPPEGRSRGYGSAATAAISQLLLERGAKRCLLFTDLANSTSNAIYQRVGYRPVCDYLDLRASSTGER